MAKLTDTQQLQIQTALSELERGLNYLNSTDRVIAIATDHPGTSALDFTSQDGQSSLRPIDKRLGADIAAFYSCLSKLKTFLNIHGASPQQ